MSWSNGDIIFSNQVGGSDLSYTALFSTGGTPQENDLIVITGSSSGDGVNAGTVTMPAGWTEVYQYSAIGVSESAVFVFYAIAGASGALPELTVSRTAGERHYFRALGYRNTLGAPEFKSFTVQENIAAGTSAVLAGGIAVPYNDALVITAIGSGSTTTANNISSVGTPNSADSSTSATMARTAPDSEWTQRYNFTTSAGNDCAFATADTLITDGSTGNITWSKNTGTAKSTVVAMVFSPAGGGAIVTNINFSGSIPNQTFTDGQAVNIDLSGYFSGTETPFTFTSNGADLTGTGLTISSSGILSGTYTGTGVNGVVITGTDAALNTISSNSFNISTLAPNTHNISITDTLSTITSSMSMTFTPTGVGTITIIDWANNTGTALADLSGITVDAYDIVTGALVYHTTSASVGSGSDCVVSDSSIIPATDYKVTALKSNGTSYDIGIAIITAT